MLMCQHQGSASRQPCSGHDMKVSVPGSAEAIGDPKAADSQCDSHCYGSAHCSERLATQHRRLPCMHKHCSFKPLIILKGTNAHQLKGAAPAARLGKTG